MKTISLELSKRLAPYLENVDTEYTWHQDEDGWFLCRKCDKGIKTLTLEEAIDFLPGILFINGHTYSLTFYKGHRGYGVNYDNRNDITMSIHIENIYLLQAIEKMLEYLLDNNLLGEK